MPITTGLTTGALMQYDSTGAWIVVSSGMSGREERRGRLVGSLIVLVPQVIGYLIHDAATGASASGFVFHQVMGVVLFAGAAATTLVVNARWVYPVQPPGTSPLATKGTGSFLMTMLLQLVGFAGTAVLQIPSYVLLVLASFGFVPNWVAYVVSLAWSVLVLEAAVRIGGRVWGPLRCRRTDVDPQLAGTLISPRVDVRGRVAHWGAPASLLLVVIVC